MEASRTGRFPAAIARSGLQALAGGRYGHGQDSVFFRNHDLDVVAIDLSPAMVARCREKGIDGRVMDVSHLDFPPDSFDAVYTMNCLLHVPNARLPAVLDAIGALIRPGGLLFLGLYGGLDEEGIAEDDYHDPPRLPGEWCGGRYRVVSAAQARARFVGPIMVDSRGEASGRRASRFGTAPSWN